MPKTKKQLQQEFTELTGRDATKANVAKEFYSLGINLPYKFKATQTTWWQEVVDAIWMHIKARQKAEKVLKTNRSLNFAFIEESSTFYSAWNAKRQVVVRLRKKCIAASQIVPSEIFLQQYEDFGREHLSRA